jgi:hypothetical protein
LAGKMGNTVFCLDQADSWKRTIGKGIRSKIGISGRGSWRLRNVPKAKHRHAESIEGGDPYPD